jgi:hypothetical protein
MYSVISMRKQINGLAMLAEGTLKLDLAGGEVIVRV